jgi:hypothetical protein
MRIAALPTFRKLYGRIDMDLQAGDRVEVTMQNNYNSYSFNGKKSLVLSTAGWLGGKNAFLGRAYAIVGLACFLLALLLALLYFVFPMSVSATAELKPSVLHPLHEMFMDSYVGMMRLRDDRCSSADVLVLMCWFSGERSICRCTTLLLDLYDD